MRGPRALLLLLTSAALSVSPAPAEATTALAISPAEATDMQNTRLVDRIAAVVNGEVITLAQVNREVRLQETELARSTDNCTAAPGARPDPDPRMLQCMIDRLLMFQHVRRFPQFDVVAADIAGLATADVRDHLADLERARLVGPDLHGRRSLAHDQLRRLLVDELAPADRQELHGAAVRALDTLRESGIAVPLAEIARHALAGALSARALVVLPAAAAELRATGNAAGALNLLNARAELFAELPVEERRERSHEDLAARQAAAEILFRSGRRREAADAFLDLLGACRGASDSLAEARALCGLGTTLNNTGALEEAGSHLRRALELAERESGEAEADE